MYKNEETKSIEIKNLEYAFKTGLISFRQYLKLLSEIIIELNY